MRLFGLFCCLLPVWAAAACGEYAFDLNWQENSASYVKTVRLDRHEPFGKEPDTAQNVVFRGILDLGYGDYVKNAGFLWDKANQKLYVDLNADGDLTNDPNSVFTSGMIGDFQMFPAFLISFESEEGIRQFKIEARLRDASWAKQAEFAVLSAYAGSVELYGRKWRFTIWDDLNRKTMEPDYFAIHPAEADAGRYWSVPQSLFVGGRCYELGFQSQQTDNRRLKVTCFLKETPLALGELKVEGTSIKHLVLGNEQMLIFPEPTDGISQVPAGQYECQGCTLVGADEVFISPADVHSIKVLVEEARQNSLKIGGPLKQSVIVNRSGKSLNFSYQLTGAGGEGYDIRSLQNYDYSKTPSVAVYKGTTQLASGRFEYG